MLATSLRHIVTRSITHLGSCPGVVVSTGLCATPAAACTKETAGSGCPSWQQLRAFSGTAWHGTTVICVRKGNKVVMMADGQITAGSRVIKPNAKKLRRIGDNVIGGFAGATADALTLFERLELKLEAHPGQLKRAAVELAKAWRQDRVLRRLEASMLVADAQVTLEISGDGDILEPQDGVIAIGSGGGFALAAARALVDIPHMDAEAIARKAMGIAAESCIMTNTAFTLDHIDLPPPPQ